MLLEPLVAELPGIRSLLEGRKEVIHHSSLRLLKVDFLEGLQHRGRRQQVSGDHLLEGLAGRRMARFASKGDGQMPEGIFRLAGISQQPGKKHVIVGKAALADLDRTAQGMHGRLGLAESYLCLSQREEQDTVITPLIGDAGKGLLGDLRLALQQRQSSDAGGDAQVLRVLSAERLESHRLDPGALHDLAELCGCDPEGRAAGLGLRQCQESLLLLADQIRTHLHLRQQSDDSGG